MWDIFNLNYCCTGSVGKLILSIRSVEIFFLQGTERKIPLGKSGSNRI